MAQGCAGGKGLSGKVCSLRVADKGRKLARFGAGADRVCPMAAKEFGAAAIAQVFDPWRDFAGDAVPNKAGGVGIV